MRETGSDGLVFGSSGCEALKRLLCLEEGDRGGVLGPELSMELVLSECVMKRGIEEIGRGGNCGKLHEVAARSFTGLPIACVCVTHSGKIAGDEDEGWGQMVATD